MAGPLSHIRVLDLSRVLAGPWAGQNLADLGAEVIKVERPGSGDDSRAFGPPWVKDKDGRDTRDSAYYTSANRGKKSITLNISKLQGQKLARELAAISDVLIENYKFGDLARYGLSYEDLKKTNPRLIYCSVTGFGQTGPYRERPGYDFMIQGMGGMMSVTGEPDDAPGGGPQRAGVPVADRSRFSPTRTPTTSPPAKPPGGSATCTRTSRRTSRSARRTAASSSPAATTTSTASSARSPRRLSSPTIRASPRTASASRTARS